MPRAMGDPQAIRALARKVRQSSQEMDKVASGLLAALKSTDWDDATMRRFESDLQNLTQRMRALKPMAEQASTYLEGKARQLDDYLR